MSARAAQRSTWIWRAAAAAVTVVLALPAAALAQVSFSDPTAYDAGGSRPDATAVGDFNGDSDPDLVAVNNASKNLAVLLGGTGGTFGAATNFAVGEEPSGVAVADFNGDSDPDLVVVNTATNNVSVLLGGAAGSFGAATNYPVGSAPSGVAVGDFNGDSDPDLAVANSGSRNVSVLLGGAGGTFGAATDHDTGLRPQAIAVADFNGDSDPDLATANYDPANLDAGTVSVFLGGTGSSFGAATSHPVGGLPRALAVADFNGDSDPDLAVAKDATNANLSVLLGGADGSFGAATSAATGDAGAVAVVAADFNFDADPDLAVIARNATGDLSVKLGGAGGTFGATIYFPAGGMSRLAVGDFNADGRPDLAGGTFDFDSVAVILNTTNRAPSASDDGYTTAEDTALTRAAPGVLGNDADPDGDKLTATLVAGPAHGSVTLDADGSFTYTPAAGYSGADSFSYKINDGIADSNTATVSITVTAFDDPPACAAVSGSTDEDIALDVAPSCSDEEGAPLTYAIVGQPAHGSADVVDGQLRYTPAANYNGTDSFTYKANDGTSDSGSATVSITVAAVNDVPTIAVAAGGACGRNDRSGTINLTVADVDGLAGLSLSRASSNTALVPVGNVSFAGAGANRSISAAAVSGRTGSATITVTVSDGTASASVNVAIRVGGNGNDTIDGASGADLLLGQNGDDTLNGQAGIDLLCGARGNDRLTGGADADRFGGGAGVDIATDLSAAQGDTQDGTIP